MEYGWAPGSTIGATGGYHTLFITRRGACRVIEGTREWESMGGGRNHRVYMGIAGRSSGEFMGATLSIIIG